MKLLRVSQWCAVTALAMFGAHVDWDSAAVAQQNQISAEDGVQVLTRGPVHAAFAETVTFDPQPGIVVPKAPPQAIEELPPDQRPEGANVAWIPGYWAWDDERNDFLWVSGTWRALPPGRQWVPGYWGSSGQDFQWTSGYWADAYMSEVQYLPEPPATVEAGPNIAAPSADHIWAPGCWMWNQSRFSWRPGYWVPAQEHWVWVPAHYQWCRRGYVFIDGYYDYSVARRGILFAPVYFNPRVYARQDFTYSPAIAISLSVFGNQLFLRPNYNHYYFGDYYGSNYSTAGFYPWFSFHSSGHGYDPFYTQQRWQNRQNRAWAKSVQTDFQHRVDHEDSRPPRTLLAQQALVRSGGDSIDKRLVVATSLDQLAKNKDGSMRIQPATQEEQQALAKHGREVRQFGAARQQMEAKAAEASTEKPVRESEPTKLKLPKSPILAKSSDQLANDQIPPKAHDAPAPDLKVDPKPRRPAVKAESPKDEPKTITAEPKPEPPKGKPKLTTGEPKVEPKPAPKVDPTPPKVEPKVEPTPPKVEPKPAPKVDPTPPPKVEPKPAPKVDPTPPPKPAPKPESPKAEPKNKPKAEDKDKPKK